MGFTFNGINFKTEYGLHVIDRNGPFAPERKNTIEDLPYRDGGASFVGRFRPIRITLDCILEGDRDSLDSMKHVLALPDTEKELILDSEPDRYRLAKWLPTGGNLQYAGVGGFMLTLEFACSEAFAYGLTEKEFSGTITTNPDSFAVHSGVGTAHSWPIWKITAGTGGAPSYVELENETTGETIRRGAPLADGHIWRVDSYRKIAHVSTDGGTTWLVAMTNLSKFQFPRLAPRIGNTIKTDGLENGTIEVEWRERYV